MSPGASTGPSAEGRRLVVLLGTDVHPFDRLVTWADTWATQHPADEVVVQHGYTDPPRVATAVRLLPPRHHLTGQLGMLVAMVFFTAGGLYLLFAA